MASETGLICEKIGIHDGFPIYCITSKSPPTRSPHIYLSAGIHGDEPAGSEALLAWAWECKTVFKTAQFTILPCLNPWGLVNNTRLDASGQDLNRFFHLNIIPLVTFVKQIIEKSPPHLALLLHEDYDAQGFYIYEIKSPNSWGRKIMSSTLKIINADSRRKIDGKNVKGPGYLYRDPKQQTIKGPEALYLYNAGCRHVFTIETPSEFSLDIRIEAHVQFIKASLKQLSLSFESLKK